MVLPSMISITLKNKRKKMMENIAFMLPGGHSQLLSLKASCLTSEDQGWEHLALYSIGHCEIRYVESPISACSLRLGNAAGSRKIPF